MNISVRTLTSVPMTLAPLQVPEELWLQVFSFLSWSDKLNVRLTCSHFRHLLDKSRPLWQGFAIRLCHFSIYNRRFWRSLAQRHVGRVAVTAGRRKHLKTLATWLPHLDALRLDDWKEGGVDELRLFEHLTHLCVIAGSTPLVTFDFLLPVSGQLTRLSLCNVRFTCAPAHLVAAVTRLSHLKSLLIHHDGSLNLPLSVLRTVLSHLTHLTHLSWTMITYRTLSHDCFSPAHFTGGAVLPLSDLQLLDYDAVVTPGALMPLSGLRSLSVFHLYSVPGPTCHLRTWLGALPCLQSLSVHGGHPLAAYVDLLPPSVLSLTLCVDLTPEDLEVVSHRLPHLEHLHLEPWGSSSSLIRLLPQLFPRLRSLHIRHRHVADADFLSLGQLEVLDTLEILDSFYRPDPSNLSWVVFEPSPHLLQLTSDLQKMTNHRVRVLNTARRDLFTCPCVT